MDQRSMILLTDSAESIRQKVRKAVTDMTPNVSYEPVQRPGVSNLVDIVSAMSGRSVDVVCHECRHLDTVGFKNHVCDVLIERLRPVSHDISRLLDDRAYLSSVIRHGNERARQLAERTYTEVKGLVGLDTDTDILASTSTGTGTGWVASSSSSSSSS